MEKVTDFPHRLMIAARDRRLRGEEFRVLVILHGWLSSQEYLPLRVSALASEVYLELGDRSPTKSQRVGVHRALNKLVQLHYLLRESSDHDRPIFKLSNPPVGSTGATERAA